MHREFWLIALDCARGIFSVVSWQWLGILILNCSIHNSLCCLVNVPTTQYQPSILLLLNNHSLTPIHFTPWTIPSQLKQQREGVMSHCQILLITSVHWSLDIDCQLKCKFAHIWILMSIHSNEEVHAIRNHVLSPSFTLIGSKKGKSLQIWIVVMT